MVICHSIASDQCRSEILFTTKFVWYFNHRKIGITGFFLKFQLIKSIMDVAGKVNLFIWELSATLHSSSSFSVCRSDFRLVHQHHLRQEVMSQVLAGFSDQCFSFFIPVWSTSCGMGGVPPSHITLRCLILIMMTWSWLAHFLWRSQFLDMRSQS